MVTVVVNFRLSCYYNYLDGSSFQYILPVGYVSFIVSVFTSSLYKYTTALIKSGANILDQGLTQRIETWGPDPPEKSLALICFLRTTSTDSH